MVGPMSKVSFNDMPVDDLADTSNTALILVVIPCRRHALVDRCSLEICPDQWLGHSACFRSKYSCIMALKSEN